ncbi:hypothetical protein A3K01_00050 [candidate division WWE3 bacterium RIFOXYD1_FULL_43_17]|uniref:Glucose/Sorbosone dehydrogenase domain-containing protein n=3 Tax=Katanobacteria TaxID=422282 RepID=A0A1F4XBY4_UNCKA|nr:MAG: Quinoprotein glucose dehydrogenase [candidate division WWE3 bacterium GW2011_GWE1_41_27]OGC79182.1 MAG: hypothetical protein A3K01_00050 [candidate division WWE3 bacterium RIFOXYD1_FULL_43_17]
MYNTVMKKVTVAAALILCTVLIIIYPSLKPKKIFETRIVPTNVPENLNSGEPRIIVENLDTPWELAFLPNGDLLITERPGNLVVIRGDQITRIKIENVVERGEGGLMGLAVDPEYKSNNYIYLSYTTGAGLNIYNVVDRYIFKDSALSDKFTILGNIPANVFHDGGRIKFGPDGYLYVTTGDAGNPNAAQDTKSLAGKILRLNKDGSAPGDNPFGNEVYSYGHRNPQGLAWDSSGRLWATEHGPSGLETGYDELNLIVKGKNYGWPVIKGSETAEGMETPVINSGSKETWAPAGLAFFKNSLYFGGLRGETLYKLDPDAESYTLAKSLEKIYGRIRIVTAGPDGYLYIGTSNKDGRGTVQDGDDKIIKISPRDKLL